MLTPDKMLKIVEFCRVRGVTVELAPGWQTRTGRLGRTCTAEYGITHWTAGVSTPTDYIIRGRPGLPCLANAHLRRDGVIVIVAAGYANHAGRVDKRACETIRDRAPLDREISPGPDSLTYSANGHAIGLEANGTVGSPLLPAQRRAEVVWWAACTEVLGWNRERPPIGGHKEITRRKPGDPSHRMDELRRAVRDLLHTPTTDNPQEDDMPLNDADIRRVRIEIENELNNNATVKIIAGRAGRAESAAQTAASEISALRAEIAQLAEQLRGLQA